MLLFRIFLLANTTVTSLACRPDPLPSRLGTHTVFLTAPSDGPSSVTGRAVGVTTISIEWNEVDCADHNGDITSYSVRYGLSSTPEV